MLQARERICESMLMVVLKYRAKIHKIRHLLLDFGSCSCRGCVHRINVAFLMLHFYGSSVLLLELWKRTFLSQGLILSFCC